MNDLENNPWKKIREAVRYENPWIKVSHHDVITPGGSDGIYGVVHFKNIAIGIIPLDQDDNTWLVGQYRYTLDQYSWEIPMGGGPINTDPLESAKRELKEETGFTANNWTEILRTYTSNSITDELGLAYVAEGLTEGQSAPDITEELSLRKLPFIDAYKMVLEGQITDSLSMLAIFKLAVLRGMA